MADNHPTTSTSRLEAGDIARRSFGTVRRGFDPQEVRAYLELVSNALERAEGRVQELVHELQQADERARHPVIDESVLTASLGQRSAAVLRGAHEEAARILSHAEEAAVAMVRDAQQQATDNQVNAESSAAQRIAEAELETNSLRQEARDEAAAAIEAAREEGEAVVDRAREQGRAMLDQAQEARRRVLADMAHRRRLMTEQIEMLRSARDEIAGSVVGVRRSLDRIVEDLARAEDSARAAASGAVKPHRVDVPEPVLVEEAERAVADLGELGELGELEVEGSHSAAHAEADEGAGPRTPKTVLRFDDIATVVQQTDGVPDRGAPASNGAEEDGTSVQAVVARPATGASSRGAEIRGAETRGAEARGAEARGPEVHDWQDDPALSSVGAPLPDEVREELVPESPAIADPSVGGTDVDGLFARLRAGHRADAEGADFAVDVDGAVQSAAASAEEESTEATGALANVVGTEFEREEARSKGEPSPDAQAFARRADTLEPIVTTLARRLKRALQDDQNSLLDRLRQGTGEWSGELLLDEASQRSLYAKAATTSVRDAISAGTAFARAVPGGRQTKTPALDQRAVEAVSGDLASTVVTLIRRRLEAGEVPDAAERIGAAYREWRGERIERLAEDSAVEAFSKGVLAGAGKQSVRWSRSEVGPGCADCEDNALAGAIEPGDEFPTGHRHPPAHAGCRCLVLPTPT